jgi:hypothetical protein
MGLDRDKTGKSNWSMLVTKLDNYVRQQTGKVGVTFLEHPGKGKTHTPESIEDLLKDWTGESMDFRFEGVIKYAIVDKVINGLCAGCGKEHPFQELDHKKMKPR